MTYQPYAVPISVKGIVFEKGTVWLRKNERSEWELPGGKLDKGEQPAETAKRELLEELGFDVDVADLVQAYMYKIKKSVDEFRGVLVLSYYCKLKSKKGQFELNGEAGNATFESFSLEQVRHLAMPAFYKEAIAQAAKNETV